MNDTERRAASLRQLAFVRQNFHMTDRRLELRSCLSHNAERDLLATAKFIVSLTDGEPQSHHRTACQVSRYEFCTVSHLFPGAWASVTIWKARASNNNPAF